MDRLQEIIAQKHREVARIRSMRDDLRRRALKRDDFRPFEMALRREGGALGLIAEVKKASPSAGVIAGDFDPAAIARRYEQAGAHAISVLTDEVFFQGHLNHLSAVRDVVTLPVLRKDFIVDEVQIYEAVCAGADAVLLIVAALDRDRLLELLRVAEGVQLDVLVEVHTSAELDVAVDVGARIIGINNRNLATFHVDLATTEALSEDVPGECLLVGESGIRTAEDAARLKACGVDALLVGETLMRSTDLFQTVRDLLLTRD